MTPCEVQASGAIELYFYGEMSEGERASVERHQSTRSSSGTATSTLSSTRFSIGA